MPRKPKMRDLSFNELLVVAPILGGVIAQYGIRGPIGKDDDWAIKKAVELYERLGNAQTADNGGRE